MVYSGIVAETSSGGFRGGISSLLRAGVVPPDGHAGAIAALPNIFGMLSSRAGDAPSMEQLAHLKAGF